ncbi:hypothetical protein [Streptomyces sp. NPDC002845]
MDKAARSSATVGSWPASRSTAPSSSGGRPLISRSSTAMPSTALALA